MKIRSLLASVAKSVLRPIEVEKRLGTYVWRPLLNAQEWFDWGTRHGIPNLMPAADMHVTIVHSTVDVKMPLDTVPISVFVKGYWPAMFCAMGPNDESFVLAFSDWTLSDRHWSWVDAGAVSAWPTYRAHLTFTNDYGDWELPDTALKDVPDLLIFGGEEIGPIRATDLAEEDAGVDEEGMELEDDDLTVVIVIERAVQEAAAKALQKPVASQLDEAGLRDIAKGRPVSRAVMKSLARRDWAPQEIKKAAGVEPADPATGAGEIVVIKGKKYVRKEKRIDVGAISEDKLKSLEQKFKFKALDEDKRMVWGWASVATIGGEPVVDYEGDTITTDAQREWLHDLMKGTRAGGFEHGRTEAGEVVVKAEVVEGIVLDAEIQKALNIDLGMEGVLTCTHITDDETWAMVKEGNWMHSIAGTMLVEVEE